MASLQTDFPVISTESAIERLEREMKSRCFCRRAVLKNLRIERVGVVVVCQFQDEMKYFYRVDLDSTVESRSIGWSLSPTLSGDSACPSCSPENPWSVHFDALASEDEGEEVASVSNDTGICPSCGAILCDDADYMKSNAKSDCQVCHGTGYVNRTLKVRCQRKCVSDSRQLNRSSLSDDLLNTGKGQLVYSLIAL